jgi:transposase
LNPIERLWQYLKSDLRWASFKTLEELQIKLSQLLAELTPEIIAGITGYPFILDALSVVNIINGSDNFYKLGKKLSIPLW